ncbi:hypothetical protein [Actinoplanes sp. NPDC020271]|uniref:hypothetical protein n=1 Tax=Actinoplanes sp. NPDC020271 TaxID=3363896 RepID=UPI0037AD301E
MTAARMEIIDPTSTSTVAETVVAEREAWMEQLRERAALTRRRRAAVAAERQATRQRRAHGLVERQAARLMRARARPPA